MEKCTRIQHHEKIMNKAISTMPDESTIYELSELFKVFGDSSRIKILYSMINAELCVCDIATVVGMTQSAVSHQLKTLKQTRLIKSRKEGKGVYYSLDDAHIQVIFNVGLSHIEEERR